MDENRKNPSLLVWGIAFLLVLVLVIYPLSVGPCEWLGAHDLIPEYVAPVLQFLYWPLAWIYENSPEPVRKAMEWYLHLWV